ncbi:MAG TPA: type VI secretion system accessory protein TagJ [Vicinamibacterales bacterium]|nr:type VI secretion system accessory protein TagJ [Vicinamibacterales bacterium]
MSSLALAEQAVRTGNPDAALKTLQEHVRQSPSDAKARVFLFQLLCIVGQWERALTQLNVAAELDASTLAMAQMYREALQCEKLRAEVFGGKRSPMVFGEPPEWIALLIESLLVRDTDRSGETQSLRERAFEAAPPTAGSIDGQPFEWIADADMRLGPVCEAVINGRYYWLPFDRLSRIDLEAPADLRDVVWTPAHFQFDNGGEAVGLIPTRYPESESSDDAHVRLARKTVWREEGPGAFVGLGQRVLATDAAEHAIMDLRTIVLGAAAADESPSHA